MSIERPQATGSREDTRPHNDYFPNAQAHKPDTQRALNSIEYATTLLLSVPEEATPLYAIAVSAHQLMDSQPKASTSICTAQMARALHILGSDGSLIRSKLSIYHERDEQTKLISIGERAEHFALVTKQFQRIIDIGVCVCPHLIHASDEKKSYHHPFVGLMPSGYESTLFNTNIRVPRPPYGLEFKFEPTPPDQNINLVSEKRILVERGGQALARIAVDLLVSLSLYRDLSSVIEKFPAIHNSFQGAGSNDNT